MRLLVAKERSEGETRVAATPETVQKLTALGLQVAVEAGAGRGAFIADADFAKAGASIEANAKTAWSTAQIVVKVAAPMRAPDVGDELELLASGAVLVGLLSPHTDPARVRRLAEKGVSSVAMDLIPRITRAQKMDVLSSQASLAGYKAVLLAASELPRYFPMLMTAAGTIRPARVVVLGAGVAGLQAIATARRLGAVVEASDVRKVVKEQVQSLGATFIEPPAGESAEGEGGYAREVSADYLARQQAIVAEHMQRADVVITAALVPGKAAPKLIPASVVEHMKPGSVIVDLAAVQGGNCELCEPGKSVRKHGVLIIGHKNLAATMAADASTLYARNVLELLKEFVKKGSLEIDPNNDVLQGALLTHSGKIPNAKLAQQLGLSDLVPPGGAPGEVAA